MPLNQDTKDDDVDFKISIVPNTTHDEEEAKFGGSAIPPVGKAYLIKKQGTRRNHYTVLLADGRYYDLAKDNDNIIEIRRSKVRC